MKNIVLFTIALVGLTLGLQAQPILIGLNNNQNTGLASVIRWDATSGAMLDSIVTTQPGSLGGSSAYDAVHQNYYFDGSIKVCRVGFNPVSFTEITGTSTTTNTEVDMANGEIYAVRVAQIFDSLGAYVGSQAEFVNYDATNATETVVGTIPGLVGFYMDVNCYNSNAGVYYVLGLDSLGASVLVAIPTRSASFSPRLVPINGVPPGLLFTLEYDNNVDKLYGLIGAGGPSWHLQFDEIDTLTGAMTIEADFPQLLGYLMTTTTYDQATSSMIMVTIDTNQSYNLSNYNTVSNALTTLQNPYPGEFAELECDNSVYAAVKYGGVTAVAASYQPAAFTLYPNPAHDQLRIASEVAIVKMYVTDALGKTMPIADQAMGMTLDLRKFAPGCYMVRALGADGLWLQGKFIKE